MISNAYNVHNSIVALYLGMDGDMIKVFELFSDKDVRGRHAYYKVSEDYDQNIYATRSDLISYPYGAPILIERLVREHKATGLLYRIIDCVNARERMLNSLYYGFGSCANRDYIKEYNIELIKVDKDDSTYDGSLYKKSQAYNMHQSRKIASLMDFCEIGPLPDCVITRDNFKHLDLSKYKTYFIIDGNLVTIV